MTGIAADCRLFPLWSIWWPTKAMESVHCATCGVVITAIVSSTIFTRYHCGDLEPIKIGCRFFVRPCCLASKTILYVFVGAILVTSVLPFPCSSSLWSMPSDHDGDPHEVAYYWMQFGSISSRVSFNWYVILFRLDSSWWVAISFIDRVLTIFLPLCMLWCSIAWGIWCRCVDAVLTP